jgi:hypothetical protein
VDVDSLQGSKTIECLMQTPCTFGSLERATRAMATCRPAQVQPVFKKSQTDNTPQLNPTPLLSRFVALLFKTTVKVR